MNELVSVVIPCYNASEFIDKAVTSILSQTYNNIEVLLVYDESADDTLSKLKYYVGLDSRVKIIYSDGTDKLAGALNRAISASNGNYILRMDADDVAEEDKLVNQVAYLNKYLEVAIVGTFITFIDEKGGFINNDSYLTVTQPLSCLFFAMFENPLVHPSILVRKSAFANHRYTYPGTTSTSEDYRLWVELLIDNHRIANLPNRYLKYRRNSKSASSVNRIKMETEHKEIAKHFFLHINPLEFNTHYHSIILLRCDWNIPITDVDNSIQWLLSVKKNFLKKYHQKLNEIEIKEIDNWVSQRIRKLIALYLYKALLLNKIVFLIRIPIYSKHFFKFRAIVDFYHRIPYMINKIFL